MSILYKLYNFDPYNEFLAFAINIPQRLKTGFVVNGRISEGSCDTEDWSNDAENSTLITKINNIFF